MVGDALFVLVEADPPKSRVLRPTGCYPGAGGIADITLRNVEA